MALVVTVLNLKGGVGKTTTAVGLAEAMSLGARTLLVDADSMGSAFRWSQLAAQAEQPLHSDVVPMPAADLPRRMRGISGGYTGVVIDSPPPGVRALEIAAAAVETADLVLIPTPPEFAALDRVPATFRSATEHGVPVLAVLTMVRAGLPERDSARAALAQWGVPVAEAECPLTVSVQRNYGLPVTGALARFSLDLLAEVLDITQQDTQEVIADA
jgi:chromosome partitioning protein